MFDTVLGSVLLLLTMAGIMFVIALFVTAFLRWVFLTDEELAETTTVGEPSTAHQYRKAA
ncbi:MAG TPA: hypothetical protein VH332_09360 [Nitrospira sp.]|jgi:hypothetical protein